MSNPRIRGSYVNPNQKHTWQSNYTMSTTNIGGDINDSHLGDISGLELDISTLLKLKSISSTPSKLLNLRSFLIPKAFIKISATYSSVLT